MFSYGSVSKPCTPGEHQNSWDLWMSIPLKMVLIGIDPYPYAYVFISHRIHGAGIYTNIGGILMGSMLPYIAAPWILCLKIGYIPNYSHLVGIMIINHWV